MDPTAQYRQRTDSLTQAGLPRDDAERLHVLECIEGGERKGFMVMTSKERQELEAFRKRYAHVLSSQEGGTSVLE